MRLRYHHLLCTSLYQGKGYSDEFNFSMAEIVDRFRCEPDTEVELVTDGDIICKHCPNRTEENICGEHNNRIQKKDQLLRNKMFEEKINILSYSEAQKKIITTLTKELFNQCCGDCNWYEQGLCSYEKVKSLFNQMKR